MYFKVIVSFVKLLNITVNREEKLLTELQLILQSMHVRNTTSHPPIYPKFSPVCDAGEVFITSTLHITWRQKIGFPSKPFIWDIHDILEQFL